VTVLAERTPNYEDRYCAFLDILGFSDMLRTIHEGTPYQKIRYVLQTIHLRTQWSAPPSHEEIIETDFRAQSISDAVAISTKATGRGLLQIFDAIEAMSFECLRHGYFIRGGIAKGPLYHDDHIVFGDALVHAYRLESQIARYPRVIVPQEVGTSYLGENNKDRLIYSDDGPMFVHILRRLKDAPRDDFVNDYGMTPNRPALSKYGQIRTHIQGRYHEAIDDPRIFEKVKWFAAYWNRSLPDRVGPIGLVTGIALGIDPARIWDGVEPVRQPSAEKD
jgi:hypothetical protein